MNQLTVALVILSALCYIHVNSLPLEDPAEFLTDEDVHHEEHIRVRRFTCDVLSAEAKGIKLNHAACGAHCLFRGRTGGYCNAKRVCICR